MIYSEPFSPIDQFEKLVAEFFGAPEAVAVDCCTHALKLALISTAARADEISVPRNTYISVPMMVREQWKDNRWRDERWEGMYHLTKYVVDAAAHWAEGSFKHDTLMCVSFGFKKHLNLGRGGMILLDWPHQADALRKMRYDGRNIHEGVMYPNDVIDSMGYHHYMTPEQAQAGIERFYQVRDLPTKAVSWADYHDVSTQPVFRTPIYPK
jgi:dTDP-4-amino-4,6-dideoxygalactose transaminase